MSAFSKAMVYLGFKADEATEEETNTYSRPSNAVGESTEAVTQQKPAGELIRFNDIKKRSGDAEMVQSMIISPISYEQAPELADHLKSRKILLLNLTEASRQEGQRILDHLSGAVQTLEGDMKKIGENIFICAPSNVYIEDYNINVNTNTKTPKETKE